MFKILLADDEGIVLESMQRIIRKNFGDSCLVETAKTGRAVIELAERFRPDIAVMDIQMPGINGIEAIQEIKSFCPRTCFIIMSAYDTFDYAKRAMELGVMEFLTKPANASKIVAALEKAMETVKKEQKRWEKDLEYKEKLEAVIPIIESGMIYSILFQDNYSGDTDRFKELLDIPDDYCTIMVIETGDELRNHKMTNVVGTSVKAQKFYHEMREIVKEFFAATVGPVMTNKVVVFVAESAPKSEYNERVAVIEKAHDMVKKLENRIGLPFRVGIGSVREITDAYTSYQEACLALKNAESSVMHIKDFVAAQEIEENYPINTENAMYAALKKGNVQGTMEEAERFFDWLTGHYGTDFDAVRLKVLELVMYAERIAVREGGMSYHLQERGKYMAEVNSMEDMSSLGKWFVEKMRTTAEIFHGKASEKYSDIVAGAREYMAGNFQKDISLDDVSRVANVSPYYFSKIFKDETGETFIEYLTQIRMEYAKKLLKQKEYSIKQVCAQSGYSDPNYFSRIFKKTVGVTPSEYREM